MPFSPEGSGGVGACNIGCKLREYLDAISLQKNKGHGITLYCNMLKYWHGKCYIAVFVFESS